MTKEQLIKEHLKDLLGQQLYGLNETTLDKYALKIIKDLEELNQDKELCMCTDTHECLLCNDCHE